jgi:hypothetical protein
MKLAENQFTAKLAAIAYASPNRILGTTQVQQLSSVSTHPADFIPLDHETRTHVSTRVMCYHLGRKEQTARGWACREDGPLRPLRVNGRLAWAVADIRRLLGV